MIIKWVGCTRKLLAAANTVSQLETILRRLSGFVGNTLVVDGDSDEATSLDLTGHNGLMPCIHDELVRSQKNIEQLRSLGAHEIPQQRPLGSVHFKTQDETKNIHLRFDEYGLAPVSNELRFGNTLSIESDETSASGDHLAEIAASVMTTVFDNDLFEFGFCCLSDQYDEHNLDRSDGGVRAVGLDASKWLPGFYWANYFGAYLCDLVGRDALATTPGCRCTQLTSGILVANRLPPDRWSDPEFTENACSAMNHIGSHLFFEKGKAATGTLFAKTT